MKITTANNFRECCQKYAPTGELDIQALSDSEKDAFVMAYLSDIGGDALMQVQEGLAQTKSYARRESILESAYKNCELVILDLGEQYNDWITLQFNISFDEIFKPYRNDQAMIDAGHKHSDFN